MSSQYRIDEPHLPNPFSLIMGEAAVEKRTPGFSAAASGFAAKFARDFLLYSGEGHLCTVAPTRSGKGVSAIVPNLSHYRGTTIVLDPKGENYDITARGRREMGHRVYKLDPFGGQAPSFSSIDVAGLSFHRSKGLEADYTILLDVSEGDYGVPSRIEDDELLNLVIPRPETFDYAEERRLFYVALTRASRGTFILCNGRKPSRYIRELCEIAGDDVRFETVDGRELDQCPRCLVGQMVERRGRNDTVFHGCTQFPECRNTRQVAAESVRA